MGISEVSVTQSKEWGTAGSQYLAHRTTKMLDMIWPFKKNPQKFKQNQLHRDDCTRNKVPEILEPWV